MRVNIAYGVTKCFQDLKLAYHSFANERDNIVAEFKNHINQWFQLYNLIWDAYYHG